MAIEQNEIKKVISVDLGNTTTSLKEYKKHIDDLRGSLLQLDETSEEYQKIAQEVKDEQDKLNEVMKVGKGYTDAAEGSYNQLVQTMADLKKQWRATADETERAELGNKILDINNQLKDLDASTGNFQRNVGDYANAFEKAFEKALDGTSAIQGPLGSVASVAKQMIPTIKEINKQATAGLSGIKKGIASTGIGLLVVALATIIAHWEDISEWVKKTTGFVDQQAEAVKNLEYQIERTNKKWEEIRDILDYRLELMKAAGKSELEILEANRDEQLKLTNKAFDEWSRAYDNYNLNKENVDRKYVEKLKETLDNAEKTLADADRNYLEALRDLNKARLSEITRLIDSSTEYGEEAYSTLLDLQDQLNIKISEVGDNAQGQVGIFEEFLQKAQEIMKVYTDQNEASKKAREEESKRQAEAKRIADQRAAEAKRREEQRKAELEAERKQAQSIIDNLEEQQLSELELLEKNYNEQKALLDKFALDTTLLTEKYLNDQKEIKERIDKEIEDEQKRHQEEINSFMEDELEKSTSGLTAEAEYQLALTELVVENESDRAKQQYEIEQQLINDKIALLEDFLKTYEGDTTETENRIEELRKQYHLNELKRKNEEEEQQQATVKDILDATSSTASVMGDLFGSIGDMMEENSKEAKAFAIMQATMNTFSSAIAAYNSAANIPMVGYILGPIAAAAATIAGIANIAKIKNAKPGDGNVSPTQAQAPSLSMTQVSPLIDEQSDLNKLESININNQDKETKVYVVESDIREAGQRVDVREDNATF